MSEDRLWKLTKLSNPFFRVPHFFHEVHIFKRNFGHQLLAKTAFFSVCVLSDLESTLHYCKYAKTGCVCAGHIFDEWSHRFFQVKSLDWSRIYPIPYSLLPTLLLALLDVKLKWGGLSYTCNWAFLQRSRSATCADKKDYRGKHRSRVQAERTSTPKHISGTGPSSRSARLTPSPTLSISLLVWEATGRKAETAHSSWELWFESRTNHVINCVTDFLPLRSSQLIFEHSLSMVERASEGNTRDETFASNVFILANKKCIRDALSERRTLAVCMGQTLLLIERSSILLYRTFVHRVEHFIFVFILLTNKSQLISKVEYDSSIFIWQLSTLNGAKRDREDITRLRFVDRNLTFLRSLHRCMYRPAHSKNEVFAC